jgi:hypothetical protein
MANETVITVAKLVTWRTQWLKEINENGIKGDVEFGVRAMAVNALMELCIQVANLNQTIKKAGEDISGIHPPA